MRPAYSTFGDTQVAPRRASAGRACMAAGGGMLLWSLLPLVWHNKPSIVSSSATPAASATQSATGAQSATPTGAVAADAAFAPDTGNSAALLHPANKSEQAEVSALYESWKAAWKRKDIDACMRLYAPNSRLRAPGGGRYDHDETRGWLLGVWNDTPFSITSKPLVIYSDGRRATFISEETYKQDQNSANTGSVHNDRFVWQKQLARRAPKQPAWLIVEQSYMRSTVDTD